MGNTHHKKSKRKSKNSYNVKVTNEGDGDTDAEMSRRNSGTTRKQLAREIFSEERVRVDLKGYMISGDAIDIDGKLGAGAAGQVFRGTYQCNKVALKLTNSLWFGELTDKDAMKEFAHEAMILLGLSHPNIVRLYGVTEMGDPSNPHGKTPRSGVRDAQDWSRDPDSFDDDEEEEGEEMNRNIYMVTELCATSLRKVLTAHDGVGTVADSYCLLRWCTQMCSALQYLHGINVLHMDVKPANVLLDRNKNIKLCDFGLASFTVKRKRDKTSQFAAMSGFGRKGRWRLAVLTKDESDKEQAVDFVYEGYGTPEFMPPEVLTANMGDIIKYPKKIDVWAFGVVVWMILSPTPVESRLGMYRPGASKVEMVRKLQNAGTPHVKMSPRMIRDLESRGAEALRGIVNDCWDFHPSTRPSFDSIMARLRRIRPVSTQLESEELRKISDETKTSLNSSFSDLPLPSEWEAHRDPASGRIYYSNTRTQKTQWVHPMKGLSRASLVGMSSNEDTGTGALIDSSKREGKREDIATAEETVVLEKMHTDDSLPPGLGTPPPTPNDDVPDTVRWFYKTSERGSPVLGPFRRSEMKRWLVLGKLGNEGAKCGLTTQGPFFSLGALGENVFEDVREIAAKTTHWWYKSNSGAIFGPFSSSKMSRWLQAKRLPRDLQICASEERGKDAAPPNADSAFFFPIVALGLRPFVRPSTLESRSRSSSELSRGTSSRPNLVIATTSKCKKVSDVPDVDRFCPQHHPLILKSTNDLGLVGDARVRCSVCGALQLRNERIWACERCSFVRCRACDAAVLLANSRSLYPRGTTPKSKKSNLGNGGRSSSIGAPRGSTSIPDPTLWYPKHDAKRKQTFFAHPATRKTAWKLPQDGEIGIPNPPRDLVPKEVGWTATSTLTRRSDGKTRIVITYNVRIVSGFKEFDVVTTFDFDGSYSAKKTNIRRSVEYSKGVEEDESEYDRRGSASKKSRNSSITTASLQSSNSSTSSMVADAAGKKAALMRQLDSRGSIYGLASPKRSTGRSGIGRRTRGGEAPQQRKLRQVDQRGSIYVERVVRE
eukprot:g1148.t1